MPTATLKTPTDTRICAVFKIPVLRFNPFVVNAVGRITVLQLVDIDRRDVTLEVANVAAVMQWFVAVRKLVLSGNGSAASHSCHAAMVEGVRDAATKGLYSRVKRCQDRQKEVQRNCNEVKRRRNKVRKVWKKCNCLWSNGCVRIKVARKEEKKKKKTIKRIYVRCKNAVFPC